MLSLSLKVMEKLSKHVSRKEGVYSITAKRLGLENNPTDDHLSNMINIAENVFEPLRAHVNGPIKINSFYRGPELNKAIGGSAKSQHCHGQAMDIDDSYGHASNSEMFNWIRANLNYDQMIWEFGTDKNPDWVHISYVSEDKNRNRCLKAYRENGKTKYMII